MLTQKLDGSLSRIIEYLLYIFVAFSVFSIAGTQSALGFLTLFWIIKMITCKRFEVKKTGLEYAFLFFVIACIIATIFSLDPLASFKNLKNLLLISVVYIVSALLDSREKINRTMLILISVSAILAAFSLLTTDILEGEKVIALQSSTMTWGALSSIFSLLTLSLFLFANQNIKYKIFYGTAFILQFVAMIFSYVRGSWIGFIAGLFVIVLFKSKKLLLYMLIFILVVLIFMPAGIKNRMMSITDLEVGSTKVRFTQWKNAIGIIKDYPLVGVGWIDLNELHRSYAPAGADLSYQAYHIGHFHNNYIMIQVCFGIIGLIAALYMIYRILTLEYKLFRRTNDSWFPAILLGCLSAYIGFWINGLFDWTFGDAEPATMIWLTIGIALAINNVISNENSKA